jgi:probable HAF family extracellular repeat protein
MNDGGQVVGISTTADGASRAFLWDGGTRIMSDLGTR